MKVLRTASLGSNFNGSYKKECKSNEISNQSSMLFFLQIKFSSPDNITARNSKINVTKSYILVNAVGVLALM